MVRKLDKYGLNRQFKNNPCSRRDPFPRDHLPFVDDMSVKKTLDEAINASKPSRWSKVKDKSRKEIERIHKSANNATKKMRKDANKLTRGVKKGVKKFAHSKLEQYALEGAFLGLEFLAAAMVVMSDGAAAPAAEVVAEEGIELQGIAGAEMAGEGVATEETSLLRRGPLRRRTTRSGREY